MSEQGSNELAATFERLADLSHPAGDDELIAFFDSLPAVAAEDMIGEWRGSILSRDHPVDGQLQAMRWAGKRFVGPDEVYPIISLDEYGQRVVNDILGTASLREVVFRGVSTATMVYDASPVFDHFRRVDANRVVGVMDQKGNDRSLVFWLERIDS